MPTVADLGDAKKRQRPGVYDHIDSAALGRAVKTKYPGQYEQFSDTAAPVDLRGQNTGTDTSGQGFWSHALSTIKSLPEAVQSGSILSGPVQAVGQSMQDYLSNPTVGNSLRAIPGVGMAMDALSRPYQTAASGDTAGAWGDAADLSGQLALSRVGDVPAVASDIANKIPSLSDVGAVLKGAKNGAWQEGTRLVPMPMLASHGLKVPNFIRGAMAGEAAGRWIPYIGSPEMQQIGGVVGGLVPPIKGAIEGGRSALADLRLRQAIESTRGRVPEYQDILPTPLTPPPSVEPIPATATPSGRTIPSVEERIARAGSQTIAPNPFESFTGTAAQKRAIAKGNASFTQAPTAVVPQSAADMLRSTSGAPAPSRAELLKPPPDPTVAGAPPPLVTDLSAPAAGDIPPVPGAPPPVVAGAPPPATDNGSSFGGGILGDSERIVKNTADMNAREMAEAALKNQLAAAAKKNNTIASYVLKNGLDGSQWDALPVEKQNEWIDKVNLERWKALPDAQRKKYTLKDGTMSSRFGYNHLGADFDPSAEPSRWGRDAATGARHIGDEIRRLMATGSGGREFSDPWSVPALPPPPTPPMLPMPESYGQFPALPTAPTPAGAGYGYGAR